MEEFCTGGPRRWRFPVLSRFCQGMRWPRARFRIRSATATTNKIGATPSRKPSLSTVRPISRRTTATPTTANTIVFIALTSLQFAHVESWDE